MNNKSFFIFLILIFTIIPLVSACSPTTTTTTMTSIVTSTTTSTNEVISSITSTNIKATITMSTDFPDKGEISINGTYYHYQKLAEDFMTGGSVEFENVTFTPNLAEWTDENYWFAVKFPDGNIEYLMDSSVQSFNRPIRIKFTSHRNPQAGVMLTFRRYDDEKGFTYWPQVTYLLVRS